jgi:hypothetical protein
MAVRGKPSLAHVYDERHACVHCGMYESNVIRMSHVCKPWRELEFDTEAAEAKGMTLEEYREGEEADGE